jgi:hypothetical protein
MLTASMRMLCPHCERKNKHCRKQADNSLHEKLSIRVRSTMSLLIEMVDFIPTSAAIYQQVHRAIPGSRTPRKHLSLRYGYA